MLHDPEHTPEDDCAHSMPLDVPEVFFDFLEEWREMFHGKIDEFLAFSSEFILSSDTIPDFVTRDACGPGNTVVHQRADAFDLLSCAGCLHVSFGMLSRYEFMHLDDALISHHCSTVSTHHNDAVLLAEKFEDVRILVDLQFAALSRHLEVIFPNGGCSDSDEDSVEYSSIEEMHMEDLSTYLGHALFGARDFDKFMAVSRLASADTLDDFHALIKESGLNRFCWRLRSAQRRCGSACDFYSFVRALAFDEHRHITHGWEDQITLDKEATRKIYGFLGRIAQEIVLASSPPRR
eukprot:TRINITY_DN72817_c0_g1_i1.p1 TRINITY_DN72817_c0_g1~~TRINITY_DN72817_c0_g1_i1.p1  ORF type:complete len:293 (+),score=22.63 TRINITY_DN72817_c0_g1_i1:205-1083(+)